MACENNTDKYISVVENLIKLDPTVYNNFDHAAGFILQSVLTPEQKSLALHHMAHIYNGLAGLDPAFYVSGKSNNVIDSVVLLHEPDEYMKAMEELYDVKKPVVIKSETISKRIDALGAMSSVTLEDLNGSDGILTLIKNYFNVTSFNTVEERDSALDQITVVLKDELNSLKVPEAKKALLIRQVDDMKKMLTKTSLYVPLNDVADVAALNNVLVTLNTGMMIEAVDTPDGLYSISPDGVKQPIDPETIISSKDSRNEDTSKSNAGEQVFYEDTLLSNFKVKAVNSKEQAAVMSKLQSMASPQAGVKIHAVQISSIGDDRVRRIQEAAVSNPSLNALSNRQYETFENSTQRAFLQSTATGKVVTVSRPKASEQAYVLVGEVIGSGEKFYLYPLDNFVFVSSDNTTEKIDFANAGHLKQVQQLSVKQTKDGQMALTESDMDNLAKSYANFQSFKKKVDVSINEAFDNGETSKDISTEFFSNFDFTGSSSNKTKSNLAEEVKNNKSLSRRLTVVKKAPVMADGKIVDSVISSEVRDIPFYFTRKTGGKYTCVSFLSDEEYIAHDENGKVSYRKQETYAKEVLGIDEDTILTIVPDKEDKTGKKNSQKNVLIQFNNNGTYGYRLAEPIRPLTYTEQFASFILKLSNVLTTSQNRITDIKNFDKGMFTFRTTNVAGETKYAPLKLNFAAGSKTNNHQIQIEIRPHHDYGKKYAFITDNEGKNKKYFNFPLDEQKIHRLAKAFQLKGPLSEKVKEEFPVFKSINTSTEEGQVQFFSMLNTMMAEQNPPASVVELVNLVKKEEENFTHYLIDTVINSLPEKTAGFPQFMEQLKKDFTFPKAGFKPEYLIAQDYDDTDANGKTVKRWLPRLNMGNPDIANTNEYYKNLENYNLLQFGQRQFSIVPKTASISPEVEEIINTTEPLKETQHPKGTQPTATDENEDDIPEIPMFSIGDRDGAIESAADRLSSIEWLTENLPQWKIGKEAIQDVIDLGKIDGNVMALFKDKVIYLNNEILSKGVVYHEAFHGVFRYLMDDTQRKALINTITDTKTYSGKFTEKALKEFARQRNYLYDKEKMTQLQAEEILADGFQRYMNNSSKPKGLIARFFEMLKSLIDFFKKNEKFIDDTYKNISKGYYKTAVVQSGIYDGQVAFELIPGLKEIIPGLGGIGVNQRGSELLSRDQDQLVSMVSKYMLNDDTGKESFDDKFDRVTTHILDNVYNLDLLIRKKPEKKDEIIKEYGKLYSNYRFMLGARLKGEILYDINSSGNPAYDQKVLKTKISPVEEAIDAPNNNMGQISYDLLKKLVKEQVDGLNNLLEGIDSIYKEGYGEDMGSADEDGGNTDDETGDNNFDKSLNEYNPMEFPSVMMKRFLSQIETHTYNRNLGIKVPRVINGYEVLGSLIKTSANINPEDIVENIKIVAESMEYDGYHDIATDYKAIYDELYNETKLNSYGKPQASNQLYNMFVDALHMTSVEYMGMNVYSKDVTVGDETVLETVGYTIKDKVQYEDISKKKRDIVSKIVTTHAAIGNTSEYKAAVATVLEHSRTFSKKKGYILDTGTSQGTELNKLTNEMHDALLTVGITLPKSLIRMSIMAIDKIDNKRFINMDDKKALEHYEVNQGFIAEKAYLEQDFFTDLIYIFNTAINENTSHNNFAVLLDDSNKGNTNIDRFNVILGKAAKYIVKYDPTELLSTIKDPEGKSRYRFAKWSPAMIIAESIRQKGLKAALAEDPYYDRFLKSFYTDNFMFGDLLNEVDSPKSKEMKLFMDNFQVALFGGVNQNINGRFMPGKSFKDIDEKSLYILNIMSFLDRTNLYDFETVVDEAGKVVTKTNSVSTYLRSYSQLEASQTNFLMSAIYKPYADPSGMVKYQGKYLKIVENMEAVVKQEFNRIQKEWSQRTENKKNFDAQTDNQIVNAFNGVLHKNDPLKADVENSDLRAYMFNKLPDFFAKHPLLNETLIEFAKQSKLNEEGKTVPSVLFDELSAEIKEELLTALDAYANEQFNKHLDKLESMGVINKINEPVRTVIMKKNEITGKHELDLDEEGQKQTRISDSRVNTYYTSSVLAKKLRVAGKTAADIEDLYSKSGNNIDVKGNVIKGKPDLKGLIADSYFNFWANSLHINEVLDGDIAMNVKNPIDYIKRLKKMLAAGSTMKQGTHKAACINTIVVYINNKYLHHGPYRTKEEIDADTSIEDETVRRILKEEFGSKGTMYDLFDGQSISSLMHQMDMHNATGRMNDRIVHSMIAKHYRELTEQEVRYMQANKVVNNPKKTIVAARNSYHKQSENYTDRLYNSRLVVPIGMTQEQVHDILHGLYMDVYSLRQARQELIVGGQHGATKDIEAKIRENFTEIHKYFEALPHREIMHKMLNSMEYHQIDQLMDTTASKNATLLPVDYFASDKLPGDYINLSHASLEVDNRFKFLQVETSGVKDKAGISVQHKMLIAADLSHLAKLATLNGREVSASESKALDSIATELVKYQESLKDIVKSNLASLKTILRNGKDFDIAKVFNLIRENLDAQDAPQATLDLFALDAAGQPVHSPNLPGVRSMLEYYFFSQYSKHVTDEKGAGGKYIHISSFGHDVMEEIATGRVIPTPIVRQNPERFSDKSLYRSRPLSVHIEEDADGMKTYFVEAIVPKPFMKGKALQFYIENLTKMFGVRIPTADKSSMVAIKVVDFMDSSNLNGIVLPHLVHLLAGSDFDVDTLYTQIYAHYANVKGDIALYGDYSGYADKKEGEYVEFIHYMMKDADFKNLIKAEKNALSSSEAYTISPNTAEVMKAMGYSEEDLESAMNFAELKSEYGLLSKELNGLDKDYDATYDLYDLAIATEEIDPTDRNASKIADEYEQQIIGIEDEMKSLYSPVNIAKRELLKSKQIRYAALKIESTLKVFEHYGLPTSQSAFEADPDYSMSVRPKFQNDNLEAKLGILSNEAVYKNLYINQRSTTEHYENVAKVYGIDVDKFGSDNNHYTIDGVIAAKVGTSSNKAGLSKAANMNKFIALSSQYNLTLNQKDVIWSYLTSKNDVDGKTGLERVHKNAFGDLNDDSIRTLALIGNMVDMFADATKKPIPAALYMNEINAPVIQAMIGVGLSPAFAIGFNFLPEIRNAVASVAASDAALTENPGAEDKYLNSEVDGQISKLLKKEKDVYGELLASGLLLEGSTPKNIKINKDRLLIDFNPQDFAATKIGQEALANNVLTSNQIGYKVSVAEPVSLGRTAETAKSLSEPAQRVVLLKLYAEQAQQTFKIGNAGGIINLFKALNPSFVTFDKLLQNVRDLQTGADKKTTEHDSPSIFTQESLSRMFADNQVWGKLAEAIEDLNDQASKIFLERGSFFAPIANAFGKVFDDKSNIAKVITSFIAINKYKTSRPGSRKHSNPVIQELYDQDDKNLTDTFKSEYWFNNNLDKELEEMQTKYPDNKFLQLVRAEKTDTSAKLSTGETAKEKSLTMINKAKLSDKSIAADVADDARKLLLEENMFVKKLFYHELAKTGMQYKPGSFMQYLSSDLLIPLSNYIEDFVKALKETKWSRFKLIAAIKDFMGRDEKDSDEHVYELFDELLIQMAHAAAREAGNKKIKTVKPIDLDAVKGAYKFDKETPSEKQAIIAKAVSKILSRPVAANASQYTLKDVDKNVLHKELNIDFEAASDIKQVTPATLAGIASKLGIRYNQRLKTFEFPLMITVGKTKYLLQGVDGDTAHKSFGRSVVESIIGNGEFKTSGTSARYIALPQELTSGTINPIGFSLDEAEKYMSYIKKEAIVGATAPETPVTDLNKEKVIGEEISSYSDNLSFALTNPVFTSPTGMMWRRQWTPGQTKWRAYMNKGIVFEGKTYQDVEQAYQQNKKKYVTSSNLFGTETTDDLMVKLLEIKLRTYPKLIEGINAKGGVAYLENSTHQPTTKNSHWETGGDNAFIKDLVQAYKNVSGIVQPTSEAKTAPVTTEEETFTPPAQDESFTQDDVESAAVYVEPGVKPEYNNAPFDSSKLKWKVPVSKTLYEFLTPFFNDYEDVIQPFAERLTTNDKTLLAKALGRVYNNIDNFDWRDIYDDESMKAIHHYLLTGNTLDNDVHEQVSNSRLYKNYEQFVAENKSFAEGFKDLPTEIKKEQQKDYDKIKTKYEWYTSELADLEYSLRKKMLSDEGYVEGDVSQKASDENTSNESDGAQDMSDFVMRKIQLQTDLDNLNMTDAVVTALYNDSSKRLTKEEFSNQAELLIANLRGSTLTNQQIIDKIKCL